MQRLWGAIVKVWEIAKQYADGLETMKDWIGEFGHPVEQSLADSRASVCLKGNFGKPCKQNKEPGWLERNVTHPIAIFIRKQMEIKNKAEMHVVGEGGLFMCGACGCDLTLKVHVPIDHIKAHTGMDVLAKAPNFCWFKKEILNSK